jgi:hypothetical protein
MLKMELQIEDDAWPVFCKDAILEPSWLLKPDWTVVPWDD